MIRLPRLSIMLLVLLAALSGCATYRFSRFGEDGFVTPNPPSYDPRLGNMSRMDGAYANYGGGNGGGSKSGNGGGQ